MRSPDWRISIGRSRPERLASGRGPGPWGLAALGLLGLCLSIPLAMGSPKLFLAGILGLVVGLVVLLRPLVGFYLSVAAVPLDAAGRLGEIFPGVDLSLAKVLVLLTVAAWAVQLAMRRTTFVWARTASWLGAYVVAGALSLIDSRELDLGFPALVRLFSTLVFYVLILNMVRTREVLLRTLGVFVTVSLLTFAFGIAEQYLPGFSFGTRTTWAERSAQTFGVEEHELDAGRFGTVSRSSGVFFHAIIYAVSTDLLVPLLVGAAVVVPPGWRRAALWCGVGICVAANISSYSRTGLLLLFVAVGLLAIRGHLRVTPVRIAFLVTAAVVTFLVLPESLRERVLSLGSYTLAGSESLRYRARLLESGWRAFSEHPVNGMGIETTYRIFDYFEYEDREAIITVHNGYLQVALEMGLPGIVLLLGFLGSTARSWLQARGEFRRRGDRPLRVLCECLLISFVVFLLAGLTVDFMRIGFKNMWLLMGLAPVLRRLATEEAPLPAAASGSPRIATRGAPLAGGPGALRPSRPAQPGPGAPGAGGATGG